jgi:hypothetical protein
LPPFSVFAYVLSHVLYNSNTEQSTNSQKMKLRKILAEVNEGPCEETWLL